MKLIAGHGSGITRRMGLGMLLALAAVALAAAGFSSHFRVDVKLVSIFRQRDR